MVVEGAVAFSGQVSSAHVNSFSSEFGSSGDMTIMVIAIVATMLVDRWRAAFMVVGALRCPS